MRQAVNLTHAEPTFRVWHTQDDWIKWAIEEANPTSGSEDSFFFGEFVYHHPHRQMERYHDLMSSRRF